MHVNAIVSILVIGLAGAFLLSNDFRAILLSRFRSYFLNDKNDYRLEWEKINVIFNDEEHILDNILSYYLDWSCLDKGALYIEKKGEMSLCANSGTDFDYILPNSRISHIQNSFYKSNIYRVEGAEDNQSLLCISLEIDKHQVALCCLIQPGSTREIDDASVTLCETASKSFAIKLRELQQRRIIRRQEKLAGFNKTVVFLAHDLKNIAAQQQLAVENFVDNKGDSEFLEDFNDTISYSTSRLLKIIEQFNLSGGSDKQFSPPISIDHLVTSIKDQAAKSGFRIRFHKDIEQRDCILDRRLTSIVINLIKNSVEASSDDYHIDVSVTLMDAEFVISVSDQGKGMTRDFIDNQLFEPFTTLKGDLGLGIGMYQVNEIINELGGHISVKSEVSRGTKVTLTLSV